MGARLWIRAEVYVAHWNRNQNQNSKRTSVSGIGMGIKGTGIVPPLVQIAMMWANAIVHMILL